MAHRVLQTGFGDETHRPGVGHRDRGLLGADLSGGTALGAIASGLAVAVVLAVADRARSRGG
jgi:hypothetical protein